MGVLKSAVLYAEPPPHTDTRNLLALPGCTHMPRSVIRFVVIRRNPSCLRKSGGRVVVCGRPQHPDGGQRPRADQRQPDDQPEPCREPTRLLERRGQRRVAVPAEPDSAAEAHQIGADNTERKPQGDDDDNPLGLGQPSITRMTQLWQIDTQGAESSEAPAFRPLLPDTGRARGSAWVRARI